MDAVGASLVVGRREARLDGDVLVLREGRRTTRIPVPRIVAVDTTSRSLTVRLRGGSAYEVRGPSQAEVDNFAMALRRRGAGPGGLTPDVPEVTTAVREVSRGGIVVCCYLGSLTAYSVVLTSVAGLGYTLLTLLLVGPFSMIAAVGTYNLVDMTAKDLRHRSWPKTTATVLDGGTSGGTFRVVYLVAGGHEQRSTVEIVTLDKWVGTGRHVRLRYDPENPAVAHVPRGIGNKVFNFVLAAVGAFATVVYAVDALADALVP